MQLTSAGLEPAIPGSVGRCLIHWATRPLDGVLKSSVIKVRHPNSMNTALLIRGMRRTSLVTTADRRWRCRRHARAALVICEKEGHNNKLQLQFIGELLDSDNDQKRIYFIPLYIFIFWLCTSINTFYNSIHTCMHGVNQYAKVPPPGLEPGSLGWGPSILTS